MKNLVYLFLFMISLSACQSSKETDTTGIIKPITVDSVAFMKESPFYITKEGDTLTSYIHVVYPKISGGNDSIISKINTYMAELPIKGVYMQANPEASDATPLPRGLEQASLLFLDEIDKLQKETPDAANLVYTYDGKGDTLFMSPTIISLYYDESTYAGGAHGNYTTSLLNFDATTGELLALSDFVSDTLALKKMAEVKFKANETKVAKENKYAFKMEDYFFTDGKYALPNNIGITKKGLRLLYNPYEVASYARGQIILEIPWKELKGIVAEKYLQH